MDHCPRCARRTGIRRAVLFCRFAGQASCERGAKMQRMPGNGAVRHPAVGAWEVLEYLALAIPPCWKKRINLKYRSALRFQHSGKVSNQFNLVSLGFEAPKDVALIVAPRAAASAIARMMRLAAGSSILENAFVSLLNCVSEQSCCMIAAPMYWAGALSAFSSPMNAGSRAVMLVQPTVGAFGCLYNY
jgi:hypothetical protein